MIANRTMATGLEPTSYRTAGSGLKRRARETILTVTGHKKEQTCTGDTPATAGLEQRPDRLDDLSYADDDTMDMSMDSKGRRECHRCKLYVGARSL
jgi:hypothetical protein